MIAHDSTSHGCVFCGIVAGDVPADIVWDDAHVLAFLDRSPLFAGHVLVVPRRHVVTLTDLDDVNSLFGAVQRIATALPDAVGAQGTFVAINNQVSQSVPHLHVHVVPRTKGDGLRGFFWPRTKYGCGEAAAAARSIRAVLDRT